MAAALDIKLQDVTKRFGEGPLVLDRLTLAVPAGTFVTIVGSSGSGKTTLMRLINRLIDPTSGTISLGGEDVQALDPIALRRRIGYVFQGTGLFPHMTVAENIAITPRLIGWDEGERDARVAELLDLVRLPRDYGERLPRELSGGQRQRVGVARALAARPGIMLMDEPFSALDPLTRDALGEEYRALHETLGLTTMMITHDMLEALTLSDRVAVLSDGRIVAEGTPADMTMEPEPHVRELMDAPRRHAVRVARVFADADAKGDDAAGGGAGASGVPR